MTLQTYSVKVYYTYLISEVVLENLAFSVHLHMYRIAFFQFMFLVLSAYCKVEGILTAFHFPV